MLTTKLTNIANAIRNKTQTSVTMTLDEMPSKIESIETASKPNLQDKEVTPTKQTQVVNYDEEYDGLNQVTVKPIPSEYIIPSGVLKITENGSKDVTEYSSVNVNVASSGGETPEVGFIINEWDSDGYATKVTTYGLTSIPMYGFGTTGTSITNYLNKKLIGVALNDNITTLNSYAFSNCQYLTKLELPKTITTIGAYAFQGCTNLTLDELPASLTSISAYAFQNCPSIKMKTLPNGIRTIPNAAFYGCDGIIQLSMNNVKTINGTGTSNSPFYNCTGLKAVWIGSAITSSGFNRYAFAGCTNITKMFIDLPRATVEAFTNYQYAFSSFTATVQSLTTDVIICNDDEGFMTKEQFDAIDWSTYTE